MNYYGIRDDLGIWVVAPGHGSFETRELAQEECNRRNAEDGIADATGKLLTILPRPDWKAYYARHRARVDCTCAPERDPLLEFLKEEKS
jgi:hypothetical protein